MGLPLWQTSLVNLVVAASSRDSVVRGRSSSGGGAASQLRGAVRSHVTSCLTCICAVRFGSPEAGLVVVPPGSRMASWHPIWSQPYSESQVAGGSDNSHIGGGWRQQHYCRCRAG